jgi:hydroxyacylglutathione hydrolase
MPRPRPRGQQEEQLRAAGARHGAALVRLEVRERARGRVELVAAGPNPNGPFHDEEPGVLFHLVVAERLPRVEADEHRARLVFAEKDDGRSASARRLDLGQLPRLHRSGSSLTAPLDSSSALSLDVIQLSVGPIGTNSYVVRRPSANEAVVVDPGGDAPRLVLALEEWDARCAAILITHGHWDHLGGVAELAEETGAPVHMARAERALLERLESISPPELGLRGYPPDVLLDGGETLDLAGIVFEVIRIPGHSPAHLAYAANGCLFSGDLVFAGGVGRTDLPGGDWDTLLESVAALVDRFPPDTIVYSGHGPATTLGREAAENPFLTELRTLR